MVSRSMSCQYLAHFQGRTSLPVWTATGAPLRAMGGLGLDPALGTSHPSARAPGRSGSIEYKDPGPGTGAFNEAVDM